MSFGAVVFNPLPLAVWLATSPVGSLNWLVPLAPAGRQPRSHADMEQISRQRQG
jgi:hypothetical protein